MLAASQRTYYGDKATGWKVHSSNSGSGKRILLSQKRPDRVMGPTQPPVRSVEDLFLCGKAVGA